MSATLRVDDFTSGNRIFRETPPVINIPTRQFPVSRHFSKRTELVDYIGAARKMVLKIHKKLPPGGILVFVTGQREVEDLCRMLRQASKQFRMQTVECSKQNVTPSETVLDQIDGLNITEIDEALDGTTSTTQKMNRFGCYDEYDDDMGESHLSDIMGTESDSESQSDDMSDSEFQIDDENDQKISQRGDNIADTNLNSLQAAFEALAGKTVSTSEGIGPADCPPGSFDSSNEQFLAKRSPVVGPLHVLPLYAMLPAAAQLRVFDAFKNVREGERVVIVATNVAETSLTIPGIKYVVDSGREKVKLYNSSNGMESYDVQWISKASASQRAGRAGRTGPGHCYCLYSGAALTNEFPEFSGAEILKTPVDGVVLFLKSMNIKRVTEFPFPTPPKATDLIEAEKCLKAVEALTDGKLTPLGKAMAQYPMGPRHSKLLLLAIQIIKTEISNKRRDLVLGYAVAVAAALSLSNPFVSDFGSSTDAMEQGGDKGHIAKLTRRQIKENRAKLYNMKSDAITVAYALQCFDQSKDASSFCNNYALSSKIMEEMSKLRKLILQLVFKRYSGLQEAFSWTHGTIVDVEHSWTSTASHKNPLSDVEEDVLCQAICAGWPDRVAKKIREAKLLSQEDRKVNGVTYQASNVAETVFLRRWSTVSRSAPDFLVYHEMQHIERPYIHVATSVRPEWLVKYAGALCTYSPLKDRDPVYDPYCDQVFCYVIPTFGAHSWVLPPTKVPIKDMKQRIDAFAYVLLDGQVLPCLKSVKDIMSASPSSIFHPVEKCRKRVVNFLGALSSRSRTIDSCEKLREAWKQNGQLLHSEILAWFKDDRHFEDGLWPKMHQEALKAPRERFPRRIK